MDFSSTIYNTALANGIPAALAALLVAQSKHETNNFTSSVFWDCNNGFGYSAVRSHCPGHSFYQNYSSLEESVNEICNYLKRRVNDGSFPDLDTITQPEQYAALLKSVGYYSDSLQNYANGLITWFQNNPQKATGFGLIAIGVITYFILKHNRRI